MDVLGQSFFASPFSREEEEEEEEGLAKCAQARREEPKTGLLVHQVLQSHQLVEARGKYGSSARRPVECWYGCWWVPPSSVQQFTKYSNILSIEMRSPTHLRSQSILASMTVSPRPSFVRHQRPRCRP